MTSVFFARASLTALAASVAALAASVAALAASVAALAASVATLAASVAAFAVSDAADAPGASCVPCCADVAEAMRPIIPKATNVAFLIGLHLPTGVPPVDVH